MKRHLVKAFSWFSFLLTMFRNAPNAFCTFERKKENHFKEELPSFKKILSDWSWRHGLLVKCTSQLCAMGNIICSAGEFRMIHRGLI
jgi:hypothetical protein